MPKEQAIAKLQNLIEVLELLRAILETHDRERDRSKQEMIFFGAEKKGEEIIELATRINRMVLSAYFQTASKDYYSSFVELYRLEVLDQDLINRLAQTAGFRNRLADDYLSLDPGITLKSLRNLLELYPLYAKGMMKFLESQER